MPHVSVKKGVTLTPTLRHCTHRQYYHEDKNIYISQDINVSFKMPLQGGCSFQLAQKAGLAGKVQPTRGVGGEIAAQVCPEVKDRIAFMTFHEY